MRAKKYQPKTIMIVANRLLSAGRPHPVRCNVIMNNAVEHESYWSLRLLALLQQMAAQNTNAVLTVLADVDHLQTECRYPESGLLFADKRWRVFYHCHEVISIHANEHGHFHLFTDIGNQTWAHVAGLSIDAEGQPLQWFTVNRWVTDGPWLESKYFLEQLKYITVENEEGLVTNWLGALLQLYSETLRDLLIKRDVQLELYFKGRSRAEILENREVYTLATQRIDLPLMLEKHLLHNGIETSELINNNERMPAGSLV